jgi:hypothetical protein
MNILMDGSLRFWVQVDYECLQEEERGPSKAKLISEILHRYEAAGDAMRYVDAHGQIAWKASPRMLARLADAQREVMDDWDDFG